MICVTNCLDFSNLFGAISSANILFDTSTAKTISTPSRFTVSNFVPIFGLTSAIVIQANAKQSTKIFSTDLNNERFGLNFLSKFLSANFCCVLYFQNCRIINNKRITGITSNAQNHIFSSNCIFFLSIQSQSQFSVIVFILFSLFFILSLNKTPKNGKS